MPSNSVGIALLAVFLIGAILFIIGTMVARERDSGPAYSSPSAIDEASIDLRIDQVERLAIVGQPWCVEELEGICRNDDSPIIRDAAEAALIVIGAR